MSAKSVVWVLLVAAVTWALPGTASAADGMYFSHYSAWPCAYVPRSSQVVDQRLPYFALYPPVYYSRPVRFPYGYSPFANLPVAQIHVTESPAPVVVSNRFLLEGAAVAPAAGRQRPAPLRIVNPFLSP